MQPIFALLDDERAIGLLGGIQVQLGEPQSVQLLPVAHEVREELLGPAPLRVEETVDHDAIGPGSEAGTSREQGDAGDDAEQRFLGQVGGVHGLRTMRRAIAQTQD